MTGRAGDRTAVPVLTTARLVLRAPEARDFAAYAAFWASVRSVHMGGPRAAREAWLWFCQDAAQWGFHGHGALMADRREDGATVGQVAVCAGPPFPEPELGWMLYEGFEGQGYAFEAAACLRDWAFGVRGLPTLVSYIDPSNARSIRLARRLGAVHDPAAAVQDPGDVVMRHPRPEAAR